MSCIFSCFSCFWRSSQKTHPVQEPLNTSDRTEPRTNSAFGRAQSDSQQTTSKPLNDKTIENRTGSEFSFCKFISRFFCCCFSNSNPKVGPTRNEMQQKESEYFSKNCQETSNVETLVSEGVTEDSYVEVEKAPAAETPVDKPLDDQQVKLLNKCNKDITLLLSDNNLEDLNNQFTNRSTISQRKASEIWSNLNSTLDTLDTLATDLLPFKSYKPVCKIKNLLLRRKQSSSEEMQMTKQFLTNLHESIVKILDINTNESNVYTEPKESIIKKISFLKEKIKHLLSTTSKAADDPISWNLPENLPIPGIAYDQNKTLTFGNGLTLKASDLPDIKSL